MSTLIRGSCPCFVSVSVYFVLVSVMIRTEDGGQQTALEDRVRDRETCPLVSCSCFVSVSVCFVSVLGWFVLVIRARDS